MNPDKRESIESLIVSHGGIEAFLNWCDQTSFDVANEMDVVDAEWQTILSEHLEASKGIDKG
jgi:hypothetical protein